MAMISGMWSNTNLDDGKNTREQAIREIEDNYQNQLIAVYNENNEESEIDLKTHPLFKAMKLDDMPS